MKWKKTGLLLLNGMSRIPQHNPGSRLWFFVLAQRFCILRVTSSILRTHFLWPLCQSTQNDSQCWYIHIALNPHWCTQLKSRTFWHNVKCLSVFKNDRGSWLLHLDFINFILRCIWTTSPSLNKECWMNSRIWMYHDWERLTVKSQAIYFNFKDLPFAMQITDHTSDSTTRSSGWTWSRKLKFEITHCITLRLPDLPCLLQMMYSQCESNLESQVHI